MKKIKVLKEEELELTPFVISDFMDKEKKKKNIKKVGKKELKHLAKEIGLDYTDEQIQFAKKLIECYLAKR